MPAPLAKEVVERAYGLNIIVLFGKIVAASGTLPEECAKLPPEKSQAIELTASKIACKLTAGASKYGFSSCFSAREQRLLAAPYSDLKNQSILQATWRVESLQILLWALHLWDKIPDYGVLAGDEVAQQLHLEKFDELRSTAKLRDADEIGKQRELSELWHWRSRTRQLVKEGRPFPPEISQCKSYDEIVRLTARAAKEKGTLDVMEEDFAVRGKAYRDLTDAEWLDVSSIALERHYCLNWLCGVAPENNWDKTTTTT